MFANVKAKEIEFLSEKFGIGFKFYPYKIAFGISLIYWPCIFTPAFDLYFGPLKIWGYFLAKHK